MKLRPFALLGGLLMASPAIYAALVDGSMEPGAATRRILLALLVATVVASAFESLVEGYGRTARTGDGPFAALRDKAKTDGPVMGVPVSRRREDQSADPGSGP